MRGTEFNEIAFFRAIHECGARALLIGRRALVLLGLPVLTADYDFWIAIDDLILTKRFASRPKDLEDVRLLNILKAETES